MHMYIPDVLYFIIVNPKCTIVRYRVLISISQSLHKFWLFINYCFRPCAQVQEEKNIYYEGTVTL